MRILIIDDDVGVGRSLARLLHDDEVSIESDGSTGLARIARAIEEGAPFELLVCDSKMQGLAGIDILMALHGQPDRPICILMSGDDVLDAALFADAVLLKPFSSNDLRGAIARIRATRSRASTRRLRCALSA